MSSPTGRSPGDHVCWPFNCHTDLVAAAHAYLGEGLACDERVAYLGPGDASELQRDLDGIPDLDEHLERGRLQLMPFDTVQSPDPLVHPAPELPVWATMTAVAVDAGYRGLRIFANGTVRVLDPARRAQHVRYEHLIDRLCLEHPLTMLCAYNRTLLGDAGVAELACVHPLTHGGLSPFQLSADPQADLALAGSADTFSAAHLMTALKRIGVPAPRERLRVNLSALEFIDHRALLALDQYATGRQGTVVLLSVPSIMRRLMELLPLRAVRLEESP